LITGSGQAGKKKKENAFQGGKGIKKGEKGAVFPPGGGFSFGGCGGKKDGPALRGKRRLYLRAKKRCLLT